MGDWTEDDPRNVSYPSAPTDPAERKAFMDKRNTRISSHGAGRAMESSGKSIGEMPKTPRSKE